MLSEACIFIACAILSAQASCSGEVLSSCSSYGSCGNVEPLSSGYLGSGYPNYQPKYNVEVESAAPIEYDSVPLRGSYSSSCDSLPISSSYPCGSQTGIIELQGSRALQARPADNVYTKTVVRNQQIRRLVTVKSVQRYLKKWYKPVVEKVAYNAKPSCRSEKECPSQSIAYPQAEVSSCSQPIDIAEYPQQSCGVSSIRQPLEVAEYPQQSCGISSIRQPLEVAEYPQQSCGISSCPQGSVYPETSGSASYLQSVGLAGYSDSCVDSSASQPIAVRGYSSRQCERSC